MVNNQQTIINTRKANTTYEFWQCNNKGPRLKHVVKFGHPRTCSKPPLRPLDAQFGHAINRVPAQPY